MSLIPKTIVIREIKTWTPDNTVQKSFYSCKNSELPSKINTPSTATIDNKQSPAVMKNPLEIFKLLIVSSINIRQMVICSSILATRMMNKNM
jgi:hypothetical protein